MKPEFARAIVFSLLSSSLASAQAVVQQIGFPLSSKTTFLPKELSNNGTVVGYGDGFQDWPALSWQNGKVQTIPLGTISGASAEGVNDRGLIVGELSKTPPNSDSASIAQAFLYVGTTLTILPSLGFAGAYAINNNGVIAGDTSNYDQGFACLWIDGQLKILDSTPNRDSGALDLNNSDAAVGYVIDMVNNTPLTLPALFQGGKTTILGSFGGVWSRADGINDSNTVVGVSGTAGIPGVSGGVGLAFEWKSGKLRDLGVLPGDTDSFAMAINNAGNIVGGSTADGLDEHAVLWEDDRIFDLNTLLPANSGWLLSEADDINDKNQIVGQGTFDGQQTTFLMNLTSPDQLIAIPIDQPADPQTAVPEPASGAIFVGLIPLLLLVRRSTRAKEAHWKFATS